MTRTDTEYAKLADPELFEERRRVRDELEALPKYHDDRGRLSLALAALTEEFDRRARDAWQSARLATTSPARPAGQHSALNDETTRRGTL